MRRLAILAALLTPALVQAYVLSGPAVLRKTAAHRAELKLTSLVVRGQLALFGEDAKALATALGRPPPPEQRVPVTASYKMPGRCRVQLELPQLKEPAAVVNVNGAVRSHGPALPALQRFAAVVCPLIDQQGGDEGLLAFARDQGVDLGKVALGRAERNVVSYLVGVSKQGDAGAALWVEKERFAPLRVVSKDGAAEVRLVDYSSAASGEWHPRVVEVRRGADVAARLVVDGVEPNSPLPDAIF